MEIANFDSGAMYLSNALALFQPLKLLANVHITNKYYLPRAESKVDNNLRNVRGVTFPNPAVSAEYLTFQVQ